MKPTYSVVIPAYNEEKWLPNTLKTLKETMKTLSDPGEIIVVNNNSTDQTQKVAEDHGASVIFEPINQISRARNTGARAAKGDYFIFLDADSFLPSELLHQSLALLKEGRACGGGATVYFESTSSRLGHIALKFWSWISSNFKLAAGSFVFCRRDAFIDVGGFSEKVYASEEIWLSRALKSWGRKKNMDFVILTDPSIQTSGRKFAWFSPFKLIFLFLGLTLFPFAVRFKSLCSFWYTRPQD